jgi:exodeoxyribonuclease VII large subunit
VVTSLDAAALHDVVSTFARRVPHLELIIYASLVQGDQAPEALVAAIAKAGLRREVDTLLICRGGGSMQDLWAFNDERVVRAVVASPIAVISGVGHETDVTLVDFAADLRAPTPTAAAELCARSTRDAQGDLTRAAVAMRRRMHQAIDTQAQRADRVAVKLLRPAEALRRQAGVLDMQAHRLAAAAQRVLTAARQNLQGRATGLQRANQHSLQVAGRRLDRLGERLCGLDPEVVLRRGYALIQTQAAAVVVDPKQLTAGQDLKVTLAHGTVGLRVERVLPPSKNRAWGPVS